MEWSNKLHSKYFSSYQWLWGHQLCYHCRGWKHQVHIDWHCAYFKCRAHVYACKLLLNTPVLGQNYNYICNCSPVESETVVTVVKLNCIVAVVKLYRYNAQTILTVLILIWNCKSCCAEVCWIKCDILTQHYFSAESVERVDTLMHCGTKFDKATCRHAHRSQKAECDVPNDNGREDCRHFKSKIKHLNLRHLGYTESRAVR